MADEHLPQEGLPLINRLGPGMAQQNSLINQAVRFQLEFVQGEAEAYLAGERMPHEWGIDSLDDMRNAAWVVTELLDNLLFTNPDDQLKLLRTIIAERGVCATDERVLELAWPGQVEDGSWFDELDQYLGGE